MATGARTWCSCSPSGHPRVRAWEEELFEEFGPGHRVVKPHVAHAPDPGLDPFDVGRAPARRHLELDAEHELVALAAGLDLLRGELGFGRDVADLRLRGVFGPGVEHDPCVGPDLDPGGLLRGQEHFHVDVAQVDERQDLPAEGNDLGRLGKPVEYSPLDRRFEGGIVDLRLRSLHFRGAALIDWFAVRSLALAPSSAAFAVSRFVLYRSYSSRETTFSSNKFWDRANSCSARFSSLSFFAMSRLASSRRPRLSASLLCLSRARPPAPRCPSWRGPVLPRPGRPPRQDLLDPSAVFGGHVHLDRLDPAVPRDDALRQGVRLRELPPPPAGNRGDSHEPHQEDAPEDLGLHR